MVEQGRVLLIVRPGEDPGLVTPGRDPSPQNSVMITAKPPADGGPGMTGSASTPPLPHDAVQPGWPVPGAITMSICAGTSDASHTFMTAMPSPPAWTTAQMVLAPGGLSQTPLARNTARWGSDPFIPQWHWHLTASPLQCWYPRAHVSQSLGVSCIALVLRLLLAQEL